MLLVERDLVGEGSVGVHLGVLQVAQGLVGVGLVAHPVERGLVGVGSVVLPVEQGLVLQVGGGWCGWIRGW